jgi:hypothetical protein
MHNGRETIATLKRHRTQEWARRNGAKSANTATQSWVAGTRADNSRYYGQKSACNSWNALDKNKALAALRVNIRIAQGEAAK